MGKEELKVRLYVSLCYGEANNNKHDICIVKENTDEYVIIKILYPKQDKPVKLDSDDMYAMLEGIPIEEADLINNSFSPEMDDRLPIYSSVYKLRGFTNDLAVHEDQGHYSFCIVPHEDNVTPHWSPLIYIHELQNEMRNIGINEFQLPLDRMRQIYNNY